jgi:adenylate kinase
MKLFNLVFIGPPGGGKGTEIQLLQQEQYIKISTGDLLRNEVAKKSPLGLSIQKDMDSGKLITDSIVSKLLDQELKQSKSGLIFDGYPRNIAQAKKLSSLLSKNKLKLDAVIHLDTPDSLIIKRIIGRYVCVKCGATYNKNGVQPKKEGVCDVCSGTEFKVRSDDKLEVVEKRLKEYHEVADELLEYYRKKGLVRDVSGEAGDQLITHNQVLNVFKELAKPKIKRTTKKVSKKSSKKVKRSSKKVKKTSKKVKRSSKKVSKKVKKVSKKVSKKVKRTTKK